MAPVVAKASNCSAAQVSASASVQEKATRNKRKFRADTPLGDLSRNLSLLQNECPAYEFSAEKCLVTGNHSQAGACDMCVNLDQLDLLRLDLGLSNVIGLPDTGTSTAIEEAEASEFEDADWSDLTESQLEELVLGNLDTIFQSAIKKIIAGGYTEEVAVRAVLQSGFCYGCKDIMSNIVDNTLAYLRSDREIDPPREHFFEDLQELEKYILAELVCVLRQVRPFLSTGDAMWCLLISDMNISHACVMDCDPINGFVDDGPSIGNSSTSAQPQMSVEAQGSEVNLSIPPVLSIPHAQSFQSEMPGMAGVENLIKHKNLSVLNGLVPGKVASNSASDDVDRSIGTGVLKSPNSEEKFAASRKFNSSTSKRESILKQKSLHLEKTYRTYGSKGVSRAGKISGLGGSVLDKKLKSMADTTGIHQKSPSLKTNKAMGVNSTQDGGISNIQTKTGLSTAACNSEAFTANTASPLPKNNLPIASSAVSVPPPLSVAETELSLSLPSKCAAPVSVNRNVGTSKRSFTGIPCDKTLGQWLAQDKKDEMILKLIPRVRELQNQLQEWTEWANQKIMQATRRLCKEKSELKTLRQEKEEVEKLKREKQALEENTMKKLYEMENALCKASGQVERANAAVRRLEEENAALRQEMEAAKMRASESAASCQEVAKREKTAQAKFQSWEKQKYLFQEELGKEKHEFSQLEQELERAKQIKEQLEARWRQEEKVKEDLLAQGRLLRREREQLEASAKSKEDMVKVKAENSLQKHKFDVQRLEGEISRLRLKSDSSRIAAMRRGGQKGAQVSHACRPGPAGGVERERECVMCLSEEMSVVFLPCAHQVVCRACNELHERRGMKDCPSCRSPIQRRVNVRYALP